MTTPLTNHVKATLEKARNDIKEEMRDSDMITLMEEVGLHNNTKNATSLEKEGNDIVVYTGEDRYRSIYKLNLIDLCKIAHAIKSEH